MNDNCVMTHAKDPDRPRRAADGLYLCKGHLLELIKLIAELPAHHDELERAHRAGGQRPPGAHGELSVDDALAGHRRAMAGVLASWARVVAEDRHVIPPVDATIHRVASWLLAPRTRHVGWCAGHRWVDEMLGELRRATRTARALTDVPAKIVPVAAKCVQRREGRLCDGAVTVVVRGEDWSARCPAEGCERRQDVTLYLHHVPPGHWVAEEDVMVISTLYGIAASSDVVRQWKHREKIIGVSGQVGNAYDLASVTGYLARRKAQRERIAS